MSVKRDGLDDLLDYELDLYPSARRFDGGSPSHVGHVGLSAAIGLLSEIGMDLIQTRVLDLTGLLIDGLAAAGIRTETPRDPRKRAGIVSFRIPAAVKVKERLLAEGIVVAARCNMIRLSPHYYNNEDDIDAFLRKLPKRL